MNRSEKDKDELVNSIANEILDYLELHPDSVDSIDGIAKWWLKRQRYEEALTNVQLAVEHLLDEGKMEKIVVSKGGVVYSARIPSELTGTARGRDPGFIDLRGRKFRLKPNSPCRNKGIAAGLLTYLDGDGKSHPCAPLKQIVFPMNYEARPSDPQLDLGAFEQGKAGRRGR